MDRLIPLFTLMFVLALSCNKKEKSEPPPPKQEALLEFIPQSALAALVIREGLIEPIFTQWLNDPPEMKQELGAYFSQHFGVDPTKVTGLVIYITGIAPPSGAALLRLPNPGKLKGNTAGQHEGVDLVAIERRIFGASMPEGLVIGTEDGVKRAIDLAKKKIQPLANNSPLGELLKVDYPGVEAICGVNLNFPQVAALAMQFGVQSGVATFDYKNKISVIAQGDSPKLIKAKELVMAQLQKTLKELETMKTEAVKKPNALAALSSITGYHYLKKTINELQFKVEGNRLTASYQLPLQRTGMMFGVALLGMGSAIAIPAFIKYTRKAKTSEASEVLAKLSVGAKHYFMADRYDEKGNLLPKAFPPSSQGWTPEKSCCEQGGGKCQPTATNWDASPWRELQFQLDDAHYYQYRFQSKGSGRGASFAIEARGDLDCDGEFSKYVIMGSVNDEMDVQIKGPIVTNELE